MARIGCCAVIVFMLAMALFMTAAPSADAKVPTQAYGLSATSAGMPLAFTPHAPIFIGNDSGFNATNGVSGGAGTSADPFVIEGLEIDANGSDYAISVLGTNAHFIVRNCRLFNATASTGSSGIRFDMVKNATIFNNDCSMNNFSMDIMASADSVIDSNTCNISQQGIIIEYSRNITAHNNTACGNQFYGLCSDHCGFNNLNYNNASDNGMIGIYLFSADNCTLRNNTVACNNQTGIRVYDSNNNTITGNLIRNSTFYGIHVSTFGGKSVFNHIHHNILINNNGAGTVRDSAHVQAWDSTTYNRWNDSAQGNYWGDWTGPDASPKDGIVDSPYAIDGGGSVQDNYPLTSPPYDVVPDMAALALMGAVLGTLAIVAVARRKD